MGFIGVFSYIGAAMQDQISGHLIERGITMIDGVRHPNLAVPIGTYTGWNLRREGFADGDQCGGTGSFIPFAETAAERRASGDPRLSLEERYPSHQAYASAVRQAAEELVHERLLLPRHADEIVREAEESSIGR